MLYTCRLKSWKITDVIYSHSRREVKAAAHDKTIAEALTVSELRSWSPTTREKPFYTNKVDTECIIYATIFGQGPFESDATVLHHYLENKFQPEITTIGFLIST